MDKDDFKRKVRAEVKKMKLDKSRAKDSSDDFYVQWVKDNAEDFAKKWEESKCRTCEKCEECGYEEKSNCDIYIQDRRK